PCAGSETSRFLKHQNGTIFPSCSLALDIAETGSLLADMGWRDWGRGGPINDARAGRPDKEIVRRDVVDESRHRGSVLQPVLRARPRCKSPVPKRHGTATGQA